MEEAAIHAGEVEDPAGSGVAVRQDGFRAVFDGCRAEAIGDFMERFVPGDAGEAAFAFRAGAAERVLQAIARVFVFEVAGYFSAEEASGDRVRGIASEAVAVILVIDVD